MNKKLKSKLGITLIALVITIIILLILAGVTISSIVNGGLIGRAKEAEFKTRMAEYRDDTNQYVSWQVMDSMNTNTDKINSGEVLKDAIDKEIVTDIKKEEVTTNIEDILKNIKKADKDTVVVYKGELYYVSNTKTKNNDKQVKWCNDIGIKVLEYKDPEGIVVKNGKYELINNIYMCTPMLNEGFDETRTRYLEVNSQGNLTAGNWISDNPTSNWYNYEEGSNRWANILIENSGKELYYTWIPRYCFKLHQDTGRSEVRFIDTENNYKDKDGKVTTWEELQNEGFQVPEAFTETISATKTYELPGYWAMKYTLGELTGSSTINYDMSVSRGVITLKNIQLNTDITNSNPITKYTVALNGKIVKTIDKSSDVSNIGSLTITIDNLKAGDNTVNITGLNAGGEVVGTMTKDYSPAVVNAPDLSNFDKNTTFYVTYDDDGKEHSTVPISQGTPQYWYEYVESKWANIVTRNNGLEIYYTWIPRYQFTLDQTNKRSTVKFITGTSTKVDTGYQIPEAFWVDKNGDGNKDEDEQLTGYWAMKYTLGSETAPTFDTEVTATSSSIKTKGITGTAKADGQVYKYYINGEYKGQKTSSSDTFEFVGLNSNTKYTILVEVRNSADEYVGSIVKQISTIDANKPDLNGFKESNTYYVLYDNDGNETIGDKIKNDGSNMPSNWYDYSSSKWANIVVKEGSTTMYYTWVPRYEFRADSTQYKQPASARTEVRFLKDTSEDTDTGYKIPEAFAFNGQQLSGYWAMKYTLGQ